MNTEMVLLVITCSTGRRILPEEVQTRVQTKPGPLLKTSRTLTWVFTSWPHNQFHSSSVTHTTLHFCYFSNIYQESSIHSKNQTIVLKSSKSVIFLFCWSIIFWEERVSSLGVYLIISFLICYFSIFLTCCLT